MPSRCRSLSVLAVLAAVCHAPVALATPPIPVGHGPDAISVDATHVWVANDGGTVSEIDKASGTVVRTIPAGTDPYGISSDGTHVWVGNGGGTVTMIDAATGAVVRTLAIPGTTNPHGVSSDGTHVWIADPAAGVQMLDAATGDYIKTIATDGGFWVSSDGTYVWSSNWADHSVSQINAATGSVVRTIPVGRVPQGIASDGTHVWVANALDKTVTRIDAATGAVTGTIQGASGGALGVATDGTNVWVANSWDQTVTKIDAASGANYGAFAAGTFPYDVASDGTDLWVADSGADVVRRFPIAPPAPTVTVTNDAGVLPVPNVTFTATATGRDGVAPTGPVTWTVTAPGGDEARCATQSGPTATDQADVVTYTCTVPRLLAGSATATYTPGDTNYRPAAPVKSTPQLVPWKGCQSGCSATSFTRLPGLGAVSTELIAVGVGFVKVDKTLEARGSVSSILYPPVVQPVLPLANVITPAGAVSINLDTGGVSPAEEVTADPPFSRVATPEVSLKFERDTFWLVIRVGTLTRNVTLNMTSLQPSTLTADLKYVREYKLYVGWAGLVTVAVLVSDAALIAALARVATYAEGVLEGEGFGVGAGVLLRKLQAAVPEALKRAAKGLIDTLDRTVIARAQEVWRELGTRVVQAPARAAAAPAPAAEPTPVEQARVLGLRRADLRRLRAQRLKGSLARAARDSLVALPVDAAVRPLIVSRRLGNTVTVLGGGLRGKKVALAISGPGYSAVRQVRVEHGLAGGRIRLPRIRQKGRWYFGIVDYAGIGASQGRLTGRVVLEAAVLQSS